MCHAFAESMGTEVVASSIAEEAAAPSPPSEDVLGSASQLQVADSAFSSTPSSEAEEQPAASVSDRASSKAASPAARSAEQSAAALQVCRTEHPLPICHHWMF